MKRLILCFNKVNGSLCKFCTSIEFRKYQFSIIKTNSIFNYHWSKIIFKPLIIIFLNFLIKVSPTKYNSNLTIEKEDQWLFCFSIWMNFTIIIPEEKFFVSSFTFHVCTFFSAFPDKGYYMHARFKKFFLHICELARMYLGSSDIMHRRY